MFPSLNDQYTGGQNGQQGSMFENFPTLGDGWGATTQAAPASGFEQLFSQSGMFGANNLKIGVGAAKVLGNLWNSYQSQKLAKESLNFQKDAYNKNLSNQTQSYNTALEDRVRARYATEGRSGEAQGYIDKNRL